MDTYFVRPTWSATSTRSLLRWPRSQLFDDEVDMLANNSGESRFIEYASREMRRATK